MEKLHFRIEINAEKEKVWNTMLNAETYKKWAEVFMPGSHYIGSWDKGSKILFVANNNEGKPEGMVSRIRENLSYKFISIEHIGMLKDGVEDTTSEMVKDWSGAQENYYFNEKDGVTEVKVEMDSADEYKEMFQDMWPKALTRLKELAEKM